ncbi:MAG: hypothetical protein P8010_06085 [Desulfosarcinaceae bacterium]|jgi:hypothetical protein
MSFLRQHFPVIVSGYVLATGLFLLLAAILDTPLLQFEPSRKAPTIGIGVAFAVIGSIYLYLNLTGGIRHRGPTTTEVRKEAVQRLKSKTLLKDIAHGDPKPEVRRTALRRLEKITE